MQSLQDILGNKDFDRPSEIDDIKSFIRKNFQSDVVVKINNNQITIVANSASLAGSLRSVLHKLKKELSIDKKIFIRIGG